MNAQYKTLIRFFAVLPLGIFCSAQAQYVEPANFKSLETFEFANEAGSDSARFQERIDSLPGNKGIVLLKASDEDYSLGGISLTSDVHIRMEPGVRIKQDRSVRGANVFGLNGNNISIVGPSVNEKAVIGTDGDHLNPDKHSFRAVGAMAVTNFWLANIMIEEKDSRFSTIMTKNTASNGTIEDITMTGAGPGWGLLQMQGGVNCVVRNLDGQGGFTLRLEQGSATAPIGIQNLDAKNIIGRHARAAVLIAPKSKVNGVAVIENVTSYGCQWAVLSSWGKDGGVFKQVTLKGDIIAHYDDQGSQFRTLERKIKNTLFLPPELQTKVTSIPGYGRDKFSTGPASGAMKLAPVSWVKLDEGAKVQRVGFPFEDPAVVDVDYLEDMVARKGVR